MVFKQEREKPATARKAAPRARPAVESLADRAARATAGLLETIGRNIRARRVARGLTLKALADRTALSPSMLSLLERGRTAPSIGTMVVIASALDVEMGELMDGKAAAENGPVTRAAEQPEFVTPEGASRRVLKRDRARGIEIALNVYPPGAASAAEPKGHQGFEFGVAIEGRIEVTIEGRTYALEAGDVISYPSSAPHRIANPGKRKARALWLNLRGD